jgi:outer membrane protein TolC
VQAEWTFFEWGKTRAEVARQRRDHEALAATADGVRESIRLEVKDDALNLIEAVHEALSRLHRRLGGKGLKVFAWPVAALI